MSRAAGEERVIGIRSAVAFLTPIGGAATPAPSALPWFPVVGCGMGALLGLLWWAAGHVWDRPIAAAVVVAADLAVTGLLHVDGLVDAADGLLPPLDRERRLTVMTAPDAGAFGVAAAIAVLLLRWAALANLRPSVLILAALWCASRTAMAVVAVSVPYARAGRGGGLATAFLPGKSGAGLRVGVIGVAGFALALVLLVAWRPLAGTISLVGALVAAALVVTLAWRRLGGYTGDVLGAVGMVAETVGLVVAAARW